LNKDPLTVNELERELNPNETGSPRERTDTMSCSQAQTLGIIVQVMG